MATPVSNTHPAAYSILPSPPANSNPSTSGEFLLQLLQQGLDSNNINGSNINRNSSGGNKNPINVGDVVTSTTDVAPCRNNSLSSNSGGVCSRTSSMEADDEQLRFADPAVAAMGPSHRLADMPNAKGILPMQDLHHRHFIPGHHGHLPGGPPPSIPFDGTFARPSMDHGLTSPAMDSSMYCPAPNQFFRPYPYGVMDQGHNPNPNPYGNMFTSPHHHIGHPGNRHEVFAGHMLSEGPKHNVHFPPNGYFSHPVPPAVAENPKLLSMNRSVNVQDMFTSQMVNKTAGTNGSVNSESHLSRHLFTQFGSLEVDMSSQAGAKECNPLLQGKPKVLPAFQHDRNSNIEGPSDVQPNSDGHYSQFRHGTLHSRGDPAFTLCATSEQNHIEAQGGNKRDAESFRSIGMLKIQERETASAPNRNGTGHWVAVGKDKNADDIRIVPDSEELSCKAPNDSRRRNIQSQDWRTRQPNQSQWKNMESGNMKPKDHFKKISRGRNNLPLQYGPSVLPSGAKVESEPSSALEQSKHAIHTQAPRDDFGNSVGGSEVVASDENDETILGCIGFLELDKDNGIEEEAKHNLRGSSSKDFISDGKHRRTNLQKFHRREVLNRPDMEKCTRQFVSIFESLIPSKDEELRRKRLLSNLEELVSGIWPNANLYLFGSCANAFGVCNSDIDVCLSLDDENATRPEVVRMLADVLNKNQMQNVQALPHARVPIVKYSDPSTGISCDVCVNNMLAVVNTKLLHDYAQIDVRLRQLAFMVKYWAKCRQVNETYRGTLSSYAYVLMCIHFLQQRKPPVLPCLQEMEPTYHVTVGDITCAYFDQVDRLKGFGEKNKETLADLVAMFFEYWAFRHDYSHSVISIRTGKFLSKVEKDWTRRIGNERHLICIEDPFETSHDLGRVVDKHSIRVLREEFQRAAKIMRQEAAPWVALFEPFVRQKAQDPE